MDNLWQKVKEGLSQALEKSEEFTKLSSKKIEIAGLHYKIERAFTDLGGYVYHYLVEEEKKALTKDKDFQSKLVNIKGLQVLLEKKEEETRNI